jgi:hypothetical protein
MAFNTMPPGHQDDYTEFTEAQRTTESFLKCNIRHIEMSGVEVLL